MRKDLTKIIEFCKKFWKEFSEAFDFIIKHRTSFLLFFTIVFSLLSLVISPSKNTFYKDVKRLENKIQNRQKILEGYAAKALNTPVDTWVELDDMPEDMVIYKYNADTIQSWVNQFPISNDEVDVYSSWYRLHYQTSKSLYNTPLAYLSPQEQYVNLGSAWYVVKVYVKDRMKVITGLRIKTEYLSSNSVLVSRINPNLGVNKKLLLTPVTFDEGLTVKGADGSILFSVLDDVA